MINIKEVCSTLELDTFVNASPVEKIHTLFRLNQTSRTNSSAIKSLAVQTALEMDAKDRARANIKIIAPVPLDDQERLIVCPEIFTYPVYILFPVLDRPRPQYLAASRLSLADLQPIARQNQEISRASLQQVDQLVIANARLVQENPYEEYNRLLQQIKMADSLIKEQKRAAATEEKHAINRRPNLINAIAMTQTTDRMEQLNMQKLTQIAQYLRASQKLAVDCPYGNLYHLSLDTPDPLHLALTMKMLIIWPMLERLSDLTCSLVTFRLSDHSLSTNINTQRMFRAKERVLASIPRSGDESYYQVATILGL